MYGPRTLICRLPLGVMADRAQKAPLLLSSPGFALRRRFSGLRVLTLRTWALRS